MNRWRESCLLSPSLICLDLCNLEAQVNALQAAGLSALHIDILDGHFSPSMPLGLETVRQLRAKTGLDFEVHLMTDTTEYFLDELLDIGVQQLVVHAETTAHLDAVLGRIRQKGVQAGVALKPATPLCVLEYVLELCDVVLLMLINSGYASSRSERQVPYARCKIERLRERIGRRGLPVSISVDGRISRGDIRRYAPGLVDIFVAGSTCLDKAHLQASAEELCRFRESVLCGGQPT